MPRASAPEVVLADYEALPPAERNVLRLLFDERRRDRPPDWEDVARVVVDTVRRDIQRAGMTAEAEALIADLCRNSPAFRRRWDELDVHAHGEGIKRLRDAAGGLLNLEYSTFAIDGQPKLAMVVFNPSGADDRARVRALIAEAPLRER